MRRVICPYCQRQAEFVDSKVVYGRSYGMIYLCRNCLAYVGVHKDTGKPLGRLANAELRYWKRRAHAAFDPLWKWGQFQGDRNGAYRWLSRQMGISFKKTHIGLFDVAECKKVINICSRKEQMK